MGEVDDATLLRRARKGDESAFSELFDRYQRRLYHYAARMCGRPSADDVVQETFLAVLNAERFDAYKGTVAAYLFGIARHHVIRHIQKQETDSVESRDAAEMSIAACREDPLETLAREQTVDAVREAVESLPPVYREVIVLCDLQEMDYALVAEVIHCPIGTVRSRLHRARALLARNLTLRSRECEVGRKHA